jgi:hypothetical protein
MTTPSTLHTPTQWSSETLFKPLQTSQNEENWQTNSDIALINTRRKKEVLPKHLL